MSHDISNKHNEEEKENMGVDDTVINSAAFIDKERESSTEVINTEPPHKDKEDKKDKDKASKLKVIILESNTYWNFYYNKNNYRCTECCLQILQMAVFLEQVTCSSIIQILFQCIM